jgi:hypothetical protein
MSDFEINGLFRWQSGNYIPCGLNIRERLWWRFMPGVIINVRWPTGNIVVNDQDPRWCDMGGAVWVDLGFSADPNDHYRWWLEKYVGKQGWDWNWGMANDDVAANRLTIKIRQKHAKYATIAAIKWS